MACYCANFYGSINCHNQVTRFGDRCKLCIALKSGASMSDGLLSGDSDHWAKTPRSDDMMAKRSRHHDSAAAHLPLGGSGGSSSSKHGHHSHHHMRTSDARYGRKQ